MSKIVYTCLQCGHKTDSPIIVNVQKTASLCAQFYYCKECYKKYYKESK